MRSICKKGPAILAGVMALCALTAASASAAQWYVGGKTLTGSEKLAETVKVEEAVVLAIKVGGEPPSKYPTITCTTVKDSATEIAAPAALKIKGLALGGCNLKVPGGEEKYCELQESNIDSSSLEGKLSAGTLSEDLTEITPLGGTHEVFRTKIREGCVLLGGDELTIKGTTTLKSPQGKTEAAEQEFAGEGETGKGLTWDEQPVYLTGKLKLKLATGKAWSFH